MALAKCSDCGKEMSSAAPTCPHCGRRVPYGVVRLLGLVMVALLFMAAGFAFLMMSNDDVYRAVMRKLGH